MSRTFKCDDCEKIGVDIQIDRHDPVDCIMHLADCLSCRLQQVEDLPEGESAAQTMELLCSQIDELKQAWNS